MRHDRILALVFVSLLCVGSVPLFIGESEFSTGDALELTEGDALGQAFELNYGEMESALAEMLKEELPDEMAAAGNDIKVMLGNMAEDKINEEMDGSGMTVKDLRLDFDFNIKLATLFEVIETTDDGYKVEYDLGLLVDASVSINATGDLPKEGTYLFEDVLAEEDLEPADIFVNGNLFFKFILSGVIDFDKDGYITGVTADIYAMLSAEIRTNIGWILASFMIDGIRDNGELPKIVVSYETKDYRLSADLQASLALSFSGDGVMTIPFVLDENVISDIFETTMSVDRISITGGFTMNDDLADLIDMVAGEGTVDSIMNFSYNGLKITENGRLVIDNALQAFDVNALLKDMPIETDMYLEGDDITGYAGYVETYMGEILNVPIDLDDFLWGTALVSTLKQLDLYGLMIEETPIGHLVTEYPVEMEAFGLNNLSITELDEDGKNRVRGMLNDIRESGNGGNNDDGLLLYVGIGVAVVAIGAIGVVLFMRGRP